MLLTKDLTYQYDSSTSIAFPDLSIDQGEHTLIIGPSGCGKTTLLQLIAGLRSPKTGSIEINGEKIDSMTQAKRDQFRGQQIGLIFQTSHFVRALSVGENITLAQSLAGHSPDMAAVEGILTRLNIGHKLNKKTHQLSQGEQQRVAIARALINKPKVILADEPTSALDDQNTEEVIRLLKEQANSVNATLIVITHDNRLKDKFDKSISL